MTAFGLLCSPDYNASPAFSLVDSFDAIDRRAIAMNSTRGGDEFAVNVSVLRLAIGVATTIDDLGAGLHKGIDGVPTSLRNGPILAYQSS